MRLLWLGTLVVSLAGACAAPDVKQQSSAIQQSSAGAEQVCKRVTPTGSSLPQQVCHTPEEWAAMERQGRADVEEFDRQRSEANSVNP